jgi:hypothetical protein
MSALTERWYSIGGLSKRSSANSLITTAIIVRTAPWVSWLPSLRGRSLGGSTIGIQPNYDGAANWAALSTSFGSRHDLVGWDSRHARRRHDRLGGLIHEHERAA